MNKTATRLIYILLGVSGLTNVALSQDLSWKVLGDSAQALYQQGRYAEATTIAERALRAAEATFGDADTAVAECANNLAFIYQVQSKYADADTLFKRAARVYEKALGPEHPNVAYALGNLAELCSSQGKYFDAERLNKQALGIIEKALGRNNADVAWLLNNLSGVYELQGKFSDAEPARKRALEIWETTLGPDDPDVAVAVNNLGHMYMDQGKYGAAEPLLRRSLAIREKAFGSDHPRCSVSLNNLAQLYCAQGRYTEAESLYQKALAIDERALGPEHPYVANTLGNVGALYNNQGRYAESEALHKRAIAIYEKALGPDHPSLALLLNNLAFLYAVQKMYDEAEIAYRRSLAIAEKANGPKHPDVATAIANTASLYAEQGRYSEAEPLFKKAAKMFEEIYDLDHPTVSSTLSFQAEMYRKEGRMTEADSIQRQVLTARVKTLGPDHPDVAASQYRLGELAMDLGKPNEAEVFLQKSLAIREQALGPNHPAVAASLTLLGKVSMDLAKPAAATTYLLRAQEVLLRHIDNTFPALSEKEKTGYYYTMQATFDVFRSFALKRIKEDPGVLGTLFDNQLATKALLFNAVSKVHRRIRGSNDTTAINRFKEWLSVREHLAKAYSLSKRELATQGIDIDSLERVSNTLEKELSRRSEAFATEYEKKPVRWQQVRDALPPNAAAVEIVRFRSTLSSAGDSVSYAALIVDRETREHPDIVVLDNGSELETRLLKGYRGLMQQRGRRAGRGVIKEKVSAGTVSDQELYQQYWARIESALPGIGTIYLSADGAYNSINPETLRRPDNRYLGEVHDIRTLTNLRDLVVGPRPAVATRDEKAAELFGSPQYDLSAKKQEALAAALTGKNDTRTVPSLQRGDMSTGILTPLHGTKLETKEIDRLLRKNGWRVGLHLGENALEEEVKSLASPRLLHIATHGFFRQDVERPLDRSPLEGKQHEENPLLRTGVFLAGAERTLARETDSTGRDLDDGILTAFEAMNLDLDRTELVVLSACETGRGEVRNGEGVYGLQRAFQVAGARYVIMSLWKVDDEATRALMSLFYHQWLKKGDVRQAFRQATSGIRKVYPSPYYWGAFVMVGM